MAKLLPTSFEVDVMLELQSAVDKRMEFLIAKRDRVFFYIDTARWYCERCDLLTESRATATCHHIQFVAAGINCMRHISRRERDKPSTP